MRIALILICVVGAAFTTLSIAIASRYVWIPDVFTRDVHVVVAAPFDSESSVCVWQYWDGDFYSTFFSIYTSPEAPMRSFLLDSNGPKVWSAAFTTDSDKVYARGWGIPAFAYSRSTKLGYVEEGGAPITLHSKILDGEHETEARRRVPEALQREQ